MKQSEKKGQKNQIGAYGEQIAVKYLQNQGFSVIETNYLQKWGEIDVVARETKGNQVIIHFVEVKTVSYETRSAPEYAVSHETWRPEEQVTPKKLQKLHRTIDTWLSANNAHNIDWQVDIIAVRLVMTEKYATIHYLPNIIL